MTRVLRPYQEQAVRNVGEAWMVYRSALLVLATGCGKTFTAALILRAREGRILWVAHRRELISQAKDALESVGLSCEIEMADSWASTEGGLFGTHVVIASVQTLQGRRLLRWDRDAFDTIVVDEAHHATARSYRDILARFHEAKVLGLTATPDRGDKVGLGAVFDAVAFEYGIREAIQQGYLAPIVQKRIECADLDLADIKTVSGDLAQGELERALTQDAVLHQIAGPLVRESADRSTIVFTAGVDQAHAMVEVMAGYTPARCAAIDGTTPDELRARHLDAFARGDLQYLFNCAVLTEGFDAPRTSCIAVARPTKSRALYTQCLDDQTEILTNRGWLRIDDPMDGARVAAFDLEHGTVHWSDATRTERRLGDEAMYGIESPHLSLRVTAGHRMVVRERRGRAKTLTPWAFVEAAKVPSEFRVPVSASSGLVDAPISGADLTFLGLLLTDGNLHPRTNQITLYQSERNPDVIAMIKRTLEECGFKSGHSVETKASNYGPRSPLHRWTVSRGAPRGRDKHLTGWERLADWVSEDGKSLTEAFELLSDRQVGVLLDAMDAGNGDKHEPEDWTRHTRGITVANDRLADELQALLVRRGFRCTVSPTTSRARKLQVSQDTMWSVVTKAADGRPVWSAVEASPDERVWCVEVDTGAIVVRRRGKVAVVGNCIGRGTRLFEGKSDCLVLDFVGNAGRHSLVNPLDVLAGKPIPEDVRQAAEAKAAEGMPSEEALAEAEREAIERAEREEERRRRAAKVRAQTEYRAQVVDPFAAAGLELDDSGPRATQAQLAALERMGIQVDAGASRRAASQLLDTWGTARRSKGLCTYKQARLLSRYGLSPNLTKTEASEAIDAIAANRWRCPPDVLARFQEDVPEAAE